MWIGVLWAALRVPMWITHVVGKFRHGLLEKSLKHVDCTFYFISKDFMHVSLTCPLTCWGMIRMYKSHEKNILHVAHMYFLQLFIQENIRHACIFSCPRWYSGQKRPPLRRFSAPFFLCSSGRSVPSVSSFFSLKVYAF